jgi:hypothetical protein
MQANKQESMIITTGRRVKDVYRLATYPIRLMPNFIIAGAQKGGTTSLYNYLTEHPSIISARRKEVKFFDEQYEKGISWYRSNFPTSIQKFYIEQVRRQSFVTGEASPEYLLYPHTPKKIAKLVPHAKLIILLRNPVERAYSQYRHNVRLGFETLSFEEAIEQEEERTCAAREKALRIADFHDLRYQRAAYKGRGMYAEQLERWMSIFPREQFLIIRSEDFFAEPAKIYKQTLAFLNVPVFEPETLKKEYKQHNKAGDAEKTAAKMAPTTRKRLMEYFAPYNQRLYTYLGVDFGWQ